MLMVDSRDCLKCGKSKKLIDFELRGGYRRHQCKSCRNEQSKSNYKKNRGTYERRTVRRRAEARELVTRLKSEPCADCGNEFHYSQMDFDHRDQASKRLPISRMNLMGIDSILKEVEKCDLVCANCHRDRTQKQVDLLPRSEQKSYHDKKAVHIAEFVNNLKHERNCHDCDLPHPYWRLDFDHREGSGKANTVSRLKLSRFSEERILKEVEKCDLVCANCHRLRTWRRQTSGKESVVPV